MGPTAIATLSVIINVELTFEIITIGLQETLQTFVSNALGGGAPRLAKLIAKEIAIISLLMASVSIGIIIALGRWFFFVFSTNDEVVDFAMACLPMFAVELLIDQL